MYNFYILFQLIIKLNHSDNFDQFVCGKWKEESEIPSDSGSYTQFQVVRKDLSANLRRVLENEDTEDGANSWDSVKKAKNLYANCMDLDTINAMSNEQLKEEVTIPWPTMGRSQDGQSAYQDSFLLLRSYYHGALECLIEIE